MDKTFGEMDKDIGVREGEVKEKVLFIHAGVRQWAIPVKWLVGGGIGNHMVASKGFTIDIMPTQLAGPRGMAGIGINLALQEEVELWCDCIFKLKEIDPLYEQVIKGMQMEEERERKEKEKLQ